MKSIIPSAFFKQIFTLKNLTNIYEKNISFNTATGIDKMTKKVFDNNKGEHLNFIKNRVLSNKYKFTYYNEKLFIKNRDSLPRLISIPTIRDKIVLKGMHELIKTIFDVNQPLVQIVVNDMKDSLNNYDFFIKIDLQNFYGTIDHNILIQKLKKKIKSKKIRDLLVKAIKNPTVSNRYSKSNKPKENEKGVPQGLSISNTLAEIFLKDFDTKMTNSSYDYKFFRYVDDILILCNKKDFEFIKADAYKILTDHNLEINIKKSKEAAISEGIDFLGYQTYIENNTGLVKLTVKESSKLKFEHSLVAEFAKFKHNKLSQKEFLFYLNNKITGVISSKVDGENHTEKKYGWLFFYSQIDDVTLLYKLDALIDKMLKQNRMQRKMGLFEVKKFTKAYYEIKQNRSNTKYIFKPDILSNDEKRELLINVFNISPKSIIDDEIMLNIFNKKVYKPVKELEKDVQDFS